MEWIDGQILKIVIVRSILIITRQKLPKICYSKKSFTFVLGQSSDNFTVKALNVT